MAIEAEISCSQEESGSLSDQGCKEVGGKVQLQPEAAIAAWGLMIEGSFQSDRLCRNHQKEDRETRERGRMEKKRGCDPVSHVGTQGRVRVRGFVRARQVRLIWRA